MVANFLLIISSCLLVLPFGFNFTILEEYYISYLSLYNKLLQSIMNGNNIYYLFLDLGQLRWALCSRVPQRPWLGCQLGCSYLKAPLKNDLLPSLL